MSGKRRRDPEARFEAQRRQREGKRRRRPRGAASAVEARYARIFDLARTIAPSGGRSPG